MTSDELDLVPLDDLKAALLRRGDHALVAVLSTGIAGPDHETLTAWSGSPHTLMGLAADLTAQIYAGLAASRWSAQPDSGGNV